jgi:glycosyltransferase involved in cell wall biosynthesis
LAALIKAFHLEFKPYEEVKLVLKVNNVGRSQEDTFEEVKNLANNIKGELGLYKDTSMYKPEFVITRFLSENDLRGLHRDCDCFVMPSSGEGFCIPAFDALLNNSYIIANRNCSIADYVKEGSNGHLVKSTLTPAIAPDRPLSFLCNGRDYWYEVNVNDLREAMRSVYAFLTNPLHKEKRTFEDVIVNYNKKEILPYYSFERVAESMNVALGRL